MSASAEKPEKVICECCPREHERSGMPDAYDAAMRDGWRFGYDGWICASCNEGAETNPESDECTYLKGPELIYCCECRIAHPYSAQEGGRDIAFHDGWLIGDEGWYCLRCNAGAGEKVLH